MPNLTSVGMQYCGISGAIPEWIGDLTQLTSLGLGNNNLQGRVPSSIQQLNQLKLLALDGNAGLTGNINNLFGTMSDLQFLYLNDNAFDGEIDGLINKWPQMMELDLSENMLDGRIPASLFNHPKLMVADLHQNIFDGPFPDEIFENNHLEFLDVHANLISGSIADRLGFVKNLRSTWMFPTTTWRERFRMLWACSSIWHAWPLPTTSLTAKPFRIIDRVLDHEEQQLARNDSGMDWRIR
jgi:hypothetical protein